MWKCTEGSLGRLAIAGLLACCVACKVGPNYTRPPIAAPPVYRGAATPDISPDAAAASIADQQWSTVFRDPVLQRLIHEALAGNLDLRIAAQRILQAEAEVGIARSQQFPTISGGPNYTVLQIPSGLTSGTSFFNGGGFTGFGAWNLDFWGLYRRQTEAARAELLATEWGRKATRANLVAGVAQAYFELRSLDSQIEVTQNTIKARQESLQLTQSLEQHGYTSLADVRQAEELLHGSQANLPELRRLLAVQENTISTLLGHNPGPIDRGLPIAEQPHPLAVPVGVPSQLLERRPDIQEAEGRLVAANARIGVARAQFFPQITLTALGGSASSQLTSLFAGRNAYYFASASIIQPIFNGGRIRNNYRLSEAQQLEMVITYQKTILDALKDVSNALTAYRETRAQREAQAAQVVSAADAVRLARMRYAGGYASYLEVLTTDTDLYTAQLRLAQAQQLEATALVQLYAALGGGWQ